MPARLRPMTPGEILDQTFRLYRREPGAFLAVSVLPCVVWVLLPALPLRNSAAAAAIETGLAVTFLSWTTCIPVAWAAAQPWLGGEGARVPGLLRVWGRMLRRTGVVAMAVASLLLATLIGFALMDLAMDLLNALPQSASGPGLQSLLSLVTFALEAMGVALFFFALITPLLVLPASILDDLRAWQTLRRGLRLLAGARRTLLFLLLSATCVEIALWGLVSLSLAAVAALLPNRGSSLSLYWTLRSYAEKLTLACSLPIPGIGMALTYCNQKVIRDGYDLERMVRGLPEPLDPSAANNTVAPWSRSTPGQ